jgi:hypothetical protein
VTGLVTAPGYAIDPGQLTAQLAGAGVIILFTIVVGGVIVAATHLVVQAWHGAGRRQTIQDG